MKPIFIVYCPMVWNPTSGGIIALHKLAHNIESLNETCYITTSTKNPNYLGIQINPHAAVQRAHEENAIVIYPEVVKGNPLKAKHIMRWLLNTPGVIGYCDDAKDYAPGREYDCDMFYKFAAIYKSPDESRVKGELRAVENWFDIFQNQNHGIRLHESFIVRKGSAKQHQKIKGFFRTSAPQPLDGYESWSNPQQLLASIFNSCSTFVSYDSACYLSVQAALCGCLSIVVPDQGISAAEWHEKFPYFKYGIAYGLSDISYALKTLHLVKGHLEKIEKGTLEQTKVFIEESYKLLASSSEASLTKP